MYHTGRHPLTGEKVHVPRTAKEKLRQFGMMMWHRQARPAGRKKAKVQRQKYKGKRSG
jgi:hypothetical protein